MSTGPRPADRLDWEIASITAHRDLAPSDAAVIQGAMQTLVAHPSVDAIYFGGARGGDTIALQAALYFRQDRKSEAKVAAEQAIKLDSSMAGAAVSFGGSRKAT